MANILLFIATFQPPDFTADMYDTIREDDLDFEDIEWQKWLQGLIKSGTQQDRLLQPSLRAGGYFQENRCGCAARFPKINDKGKKTYPIKD